MVIILIIILEIGFSTIIQSIIIHQRAKTHCAIILYQKFYIYFKEKYTTNNTTTIQDHTNKMNCYYNIHKSPRIDEKYKYYVLQNRNHKY